LAVVIEPSAAERERGPGPRLEAERVAIEGDRLLGVGRQIRGMVHAGDRHVRSSRSAGRRQLPAKPSKRADAETINRLGGPGESQRSVPVAALPARRRTGSSRTRYSSQEPPPSSAQRRTQTPVTTPPVACYARTRRILRSLNRSEGHRRRPRRPPRARPPGRR